MLVSYDENNKGGEKNDNPPHSAKIKKKYSTACDTLLLFKCKVKADKKNKLISYH
jgi:hypothetical protein